MVGKVTPTEYTELQPLLSGVHSVMRVKLVLAVEGGGCTLGYNEFVFFLENKDYRPFDGCKIEI